ncbi:MAG: hypothetical protein MZU95_01005 [Desulfomicrobium escambiense]|nr:hypothetical protein [Desulfomicrobium escambiense]
MRRLRHRRVPQHREAERGRRGRRLRRQDLPGPVRQGGDRAAEGRTSPAASTRWCSPPARRASCTTRSASTAASWSGSTCASRWSGLTRGRPGRHRPRSRRTTRPSSTMSR